MPVAPDHSPTRLGWLSYLLLATSLTVLGVATYARTSASFYHEPFADADDRTAVRRGAQLYGTYCSSCHGKQLEGAAGWDRPANIPLPPPHDASGHTWYHSDAALLNVVKTGIRGRDGRLTMPAFAYQMSDQDILATLAFVKSKWPVGVRGSQALLNPGRRGTPPEVAETAMFPPGCVFGQDHILQ